MAQIDSTGITPHTTEDYVNELSVAFVDVYPDIDLAPQTPQGQMVGVWSQALAQHDQRLVRLFNNLGIETASGRWLENICASLAITRNAGESDADYRSRYKFSIGSTSTGLREAICAHVRQLDGVSYCSVAENPTAASAVVNGLTLPAHSIGVVVEGDAEVADVAAVIGLHKPLGIQTAGGASATVENADGSSDVVSYFPLAAIPVDVALTIQTDAEFPHDGSTLVSAALVAYFGELRPGELHADQRARAAALHAAQGFSISSIAYTQTDGSALPASVRLDQRLTLAVADVSVVVTS